MTVKNIFTILIGFLHDFAAGCWAASVMASYWLDRQNFSVDFLSSLLGLKKHFFYAGLAAVFVVLLTGGGRSFTYVNNFYGKKHEKKRRAMLMIKHLFLFIIFGLGTYWQFTMTFG